MAGSWSRHGQVELSDLFSGVGWPKPVSGENGGGGAVAYARRIRRERNFGERPLDVPLGMAALTKGSNKVPLFPLLCVHPHLHPLHVQSSISHALTLNQVPLAPLLDGPDAAPLAARVAPGSEIRIGHHVLQASAAVIPVYALPSDYMVEFFY